MLVHFTLVLTVASIGKNAAHTHPKEAVFSCDNSEWKLRNEDLLCYFISSSPIRYDPAVSLCSQSNSTLISVKNQSTEAYIFEQLLDSSSDSSIWIGVVWDAATGTLIWLEDKTQKGNHGTFPEQVTFCITPYIKFGNNNTGDWSFKPCSERHFAFGVCSKKAACVSTCTDYCARNMCRNGGTCRNLNETFQCVCRANTTGSTCDVLLPFYSAWSEWGNFTQPCGQAFKSRDRNCTDESGIARKNSDCASFGVPVESENISLPNSTNPCRNGGVCSHVNTTFQCACPANITGVTCENYLPFFTFWSEWTNSTQPCGQAFRTRTRNCTDKSGIARTSSDCDSFGSSEQSQNVRLPNPINPCKNNGICTNVNSSFLCTCREHLTGLTCEELSPFYGSWSVWQNSTLPCGQGVRSRTRTCTDLSGRARQIHDCTSFGSSEESQNVSLSNPTNPCQNNGVCTNLNSSFLCACRDNTNGSTCDVLLPFYGSWSEWHNFTQPCGEAFRSRARICSDLSGVIRQSLDCTPLGTSDESQIIDQPILNNPCRNGGVCNNTNNGFHCSCAANTTGSICDVYMPYYGLWSEWTTPSQPCGQALRSRSRNCTDLTHMLRPIDDCLSLGSPNSTEIFEQPYPCSCITNPCQFKNGTNDPEACNVEGKSLHQCAEVFDNTTFICSYQCICSEGYQALTQNQPCADVNECSSTSNGCFQPGNNITYDSVVSCVNTIGSYRCTCKSGYAHPTGDLIGCRDVDECSLLPSVCGDPDRTICTNLPGNYSCRCKPPFVGDGRICLYDRFVHKNYQADYTTKSNSSEVSPLFYLPYGGYLSSEDWSRVINSMYATKSGLIVFTNYKRYDSSTFYSWRQSFTSLSSWSQYLYSFPSIVKIAAVYWSPGQFAPGGAIYVKIIENLVLHTDKDKYMAILPDASWAYIVTWHKMTPYSTTYNLSQTNTFQAVVVGDKHNRVIKAVYIYQDRQMGWNLPVYGSSYFRVYPAHIGVISRFTSQEYRYSGLNVQNYRNSSHWNADVRGIAQVDQYFPDGSPTNSLSAGVFAYIINNLPSWYITQYAGCQHWINYERNRDVQYPGYIAEIHRTSRYCQSYFKAYRNYYGSYLYFYPRLTYYWPWWAQPRCMFRTYRYVKKFLWWRIKVTIMGYLENNDLNTIRAHSAATTVLVNHHYTGNMYSDSQAYSMCCENTDSGLSTPEQCDAFVYLRPGCTASNFHWGVSYIFGDPHISTLDGLTYTFNGHGEYVLITSDSEDFLLQARMSPMLNSTSATVFTGFAAQVDKLTIVQISLNPEADSVELWINGLIQLDHDWDTTRTVSSIEVSKDDDDLYVMQFHNGVILKINATLALQMMTISVSFPKEYPGKIKGLLGNFNDIKDDDIFDKNSISIPPNSTDEEIFYVAETWRVYSNSSLFSYPDGKTYDDYNDLNFVPLFFNENLTTLFPNYDERLKAINLCNPEGNGTDASPKKRKECYLDFAVTKNADFVAVTIADAQNIEETRVFNENHPPVVRTKNLTFKVQAGFSYSSVGTINVTDDDEGDILTFKVIEGPQGLSIDSYGVVSWNNVTFKRTGNLTLSVSDDKAVTAVTPKVIICDCKNGGSCLYEVPSDETWSVAQCDCPPGWVGEFCEEDFDGCSGKPCFGTCLDIPAGLVGVKGEEYICAACPAGLTGDGRDCYDVNECLITPPLCEHKCENTPESFICSCLDGFSLGIDLTSCLDIDECLLGMDECGSNADCNNTNGSYECSCKPGFSRSGVEEECTDVDECVFQTSSCPVGSLCINLDGSYKCLCPYGYTLNEGQCVNVDECASENRCQQKCVDGIGAYTCSCHDGFLLNTTDRLACFPKDPCSPQERSQCDNGNMRSQCGKDDAGEILCYCPQGYARDENKICRDINECHTGAHACPSHSSTCSNTSPGYVCQCLPGYQRSEDGVSCIDTNECEQNSHNCSHGCKNTDGSFICTCLKGFYLGQDGKMCVDVNECRLSITNSCDKQHGVCLNRESSPEYPLGYSCACIHGYVLSENRMTCIDENECRLPGENNCTQGCHNEIGSYSCYCYDGYILNKDGVTCDDDDECVSEITNLCYDSYHCLNLPGGYNCSCPEGFQLKADGYSCEAVQKCSLNNCSHSCFVYNLKNVCLCPKGFHLSPIDNYTCVDLDECSLGMHTCNQSNNVQCVNTEPGYTCECLTSSYKKVSSDKCSDTDECSEGLASCSENSFCINKDNGYDCVCKNGFTKLGGLCVDVNECLRDDECDSVHGICQNTEGSYRCLCKPGYTGDGIQCADFNECYGENHCDTKSLRGFCVNSDGSYTCGCYPGFSKSLSNLCDDINECQMPDKYDISCSHSCINTIGSWKCSCPDGYLLGSDGRTCLPLLPCPSNIICQQDCRKINGTATCACRPGYQTDSADKALCADTNECLLSPSVCDPVLGECTNTIGSYICSCKNGYILGSTNQCKDRHGQLSDWTTWSSCSQTCGNFGMRSRTRECNNPTREGYGLDCVGNFQETEQCNEDLCPEQAKYGVLLALAGVSMDQFLNVKESFSLIVAEAVNAHCTFNMSQAQMCCNTEDQLSWPGGKVLVTKEHIDIWSGDFLNGVGVNIVISALRDSSNEVCSSHLVRKRSLTPVDQKVLFSVFSSLGESALEELIKNILKAVANVDVSLTAQIMLPESNFTSISTDTALTSTTDHDDTKLNTNLPLIISLSVCVPVVLIVTVIIVIVVMKQGKNKYVGHQDQDLYGLQTATQSQNS